MPTKPPIHRPRFQPAPTADRARGNSTERGYDRVWRNFRAAYLARNPLCCFINDPRHSHECQHAASVVDHVTPLSQGGERLSEQNVRPVCRVAHDRLTENLKATGRNELPAGRGQGVSNHA